MADLTTHYMGCTLTNPLIAASSGLTGDLDTVRRLADAGAGAVVLKSLFGELITAKSEALDQEFALRGHPEAYDYLTAELGMEIGDRPYIKFIEDVKKNVTIPIFASISSSSRKWLPIYSRDMEAAGADGIELSITHFPESAQERAADIEQRSIDIVADVVSSVNIPVAVKLGPDVSTLWRLAERLAETGAKALVLFNRYYTVDIDIKTGRLKPGMTSSSPSEMFATLRWAGFLSGKIPADIAASTGIHDELTTIKMLMAGATAVQLCSILYKKGPEHIGVLRDKLDSWLDAHNHTDIESLRSLALKNTPGQDVFLARLQYVKSLTDTRKYEL